MKINKLPIFLIILFLFNSILLSGEEIRLKLATTTSTENSGLLKYLLPYFEKKTGIKIDVIAVGTGKALKLGENGDVDVVLVHARSQEDKFVADAFGVHRKDVMYNDFIILGPKNDPAGIKKLKNAKDAFKQIADKKLVFISRGDKSGTDVKEKEIWAALSLKPEGKWYKEAGQGMEEVINMTNQELGYTLADRGTYLSMRSKIDLVVLSEGDPALYNPYGVIAVNPLKWPGTKYKEALLFIDWITGTEGQDLIKKFTIDNEILFFPNAQIENKTVYLATTIGPVDSGLIGYLGEQYKKETGFSVQFTKAGTGDALKIAQIGGYDLAIVHAKELEKKFVAAGFGKERIDLMYNDFVIAGPKEDPAGIKNVKKAMEAFSLIAQKQIKFVSRGDNSGTHVAEKKIWEKSGITPAGNWYTIYEKGNAGNAATLEYVNTQNCYTIIDRATFNTMKDRINLIILVENDPDLINYITIIPINSKKVPYVNEKNGLAFIKWLLARDKGQKLISEFGKEKYGISLYTPNSKEWNKK